MKFSRLRLTGFKSFVEPTELHIEPGLTGIVGPNGCGKSNLLEALRWVMGESSYKSMRAAGMEDVIFAGTTQRPSRNMAEVMVTLVNDDKTAPAAFNDAETLEISRTIQRDSGSSYRLNGKELRARDVQLLFADASTGSRSPALIRQGQISEIISAKPQARRLILEEAAGITGLHTRRHDAELKLKAAEQNLARLDDVAAQLESQLNSLKRQAGQATKYKQVSAEIRKLEAAGLFVAWRDASADATRDTGLLDEATRVLAEHTRAASEALRTRDTMGEELPHLREQETVRAAVLQRLTLESASLDEEGKRIEGRMAELKQRRDQMRADMAREEGLLADTDGVIARLAEERGTLNATAGEGQDARSAAAIAMQQAAEALARAQDAADEAGKQLAELSARRSTMERTLSEHRNRIAKLESERQSLQGRRQQLLGLMGDAGDLATLASAVEQAERTASESEQASSHAEVSLRVARQVETDKRVIHDEARRAAEQLQTEIRTLTKLLSAAGGDLWPSVVDSLMVEPGFETALAAALGDDIDASSDEGAPMHWRGLPPLAEVAGLPGDASPLSKHVDAPPALARVLSHVGVVSRAVGAALQPQLKPGQRLVSREGDVWRWDGFVAAADAPSAAAKRLAERNRLASLESGLAAVTAKADTARSDYEQARAAVEAGVRSEREKREAWRAATSAVDVARRALQTHERKIAEHSAQSSALDEAHRRIEAQHEEASQLFSASELEFAALPGLDGLTGDVETFRAALHQERAAYGEARARHDSLEREAKMRADRLSAIERETEQWTARAAKAREQVQVLSARLEETLAALAEMQSAPQQLAEHLAPQCLVHGIAGTGADAVAGFAWRHFGARQPLVAAFVADRVEYQVHAALVAAIDDRVFLVEIEIPALAGRHDDRLAGHPELHGGTGHNGNVQASLAEAVGEAAVTVRQDLAARTEAQQACAAQGESEFGDHRREIVALLEQWGRAILTRSKRMRQQIVGAARCGAQRHAAPVARKILLVKMRLPDARVSDGQVGLKARGVEAQRQAVTGDIHAVRSSCCSTPTVLKDSSRDCVAGATVHRRAPPLR